MAEIILLADRRPGDRPSSAAREALIDIAKALPPETNQNDAEKWSDWLLIELYVRGFAVTPIAMQGD